MGRESEGAWRGSLRGLLAGLPRSSVRLRHGKEHVEVSLLAEQLSCELRVEYDLRRGRLPARARREGRELRRGLVGVRCESVDEVIAGIESGRPVIARLPLAAEVRGVAIVGVPDAVLFLESKPALLMSLRAMAGRLEPSRSEVAAVKIYALLMEEMGFDCSSLEVAVVRLLRVSVDGAWELGLHRLVAQAYASKRSLKLLSQHPHLRAYLYGYSRGEVARDVLRALEYWRGEREPEPTDSPQACGSCPYVERCEALRASAADQRSGGLAGSSR